MPVRVRPLLPAPLLAILLTGLATAAGAQSPQAPPPVRFPYEFGSATVPMLRNAQLFSTLGALADRAAGAALDKATGHLFEKRGAKGVLARVARLWAVDMPIVSLAQVYNHEYGHITRDTLPAGPVRIDRWPWPLPVAGPQPLDGGAGWSFDSSLPFLAGVAGGSEASHVLADLLIDRAYANDRASYFDMVLYIYGKLDPSAYAIAYSGPSRPLTDPWVYATDLAYVRARPLYPWPEEPSNLFSTMRTAAWLNLLDYALVANIEGVVSDYVIAGRPLIRPRSLAVGPLRLVPGFDYVPTPVGLQYRINCRVGKKAATGNLYVRWTQSLKADNVDARVQQLNDAQARYGSRYRITAPAVVPLVGIGGQWRWARDRRLAPAITLDAWRDIDKQFAGRLELGVTYRARWLGDANGLRVGVGGKTAGYLPGFPEQRGMYVTAGLLADF